MTPLVASAIIMSWSECLPAFAPRVKDQVFLAEKHSITAFFGAHTFGEMGQGVFERIKRPGFLKEYGQRTQKLGEELLDLGGNLGSLSAENPTDFLRAFQTYWQASCPVVTIRSFNRIGQSTLDDFVSEKIQDPARRNSALALLTSPTRQSLSHRERQEFASLVALAAKHRALFEKDTAVLMAGLRAFPELDRALEDHLDRFGWFPCGYDNELPWDFAYLVGQIKRDLEEPPKETLDSGVAQKRQDLLDELAPTEEIRLVADALSEFTFYKDFIRENLNQFQCLWRPYLRNVSYSLGLSGFECTDLTGWQIIDTLSGKTSISSPRLGQTRYVVGVENGMRMVKTGSDADFVFSEILGSHNRGGSLLGMCANPGRAEGLVRVVFSQQDFDGQDGFILVTTMTTPELMPAMKNAKAIVTDEGGITCHAAIVARELGIPCVVGLKTATKELKNGDFVHVDATAGTVTKKK